MVKQDCQIKQIDQILDEAIMNTKPHYLIKWKNQSHEFDTWQPIDNLIHITVELTEWIKKRRRHHSSNYNVFVNSMPYQTFRRQRKRKLIKKRQRKQKFITSNQVIVLDQQQKDSLNQHYNQKNQNLSQKQQNRPKSSVNEFTSQHIQNLKKNEQIKNRDGMKIVGKVKKQDIMCIDSTFIWKGCRCFKIKLSTGKLTNMKQQDLKLLCPQMLCEFYENNQIDF